MGGFMMKRKEIVLLDFVGSLGAALTTIAAVFYFGHKASSVGKGFLYFLGVVIVIISLPGIVSIRTLRKGLQEHSDVQLQLEGWRKRLETWRQNPVDPQVIHELQRAAT